MATTRPARHVGGCPASRWCDTCGSWPMGLALQVLAPSLFSSGASLRSSLRAPLAAVSGFLGDFRSLLLSPGSLSRRRVILLIYYLYSIMSIYQTEKYKNSQKKIEGVGPPPFVDHVQGRWSGLGLVKLFPTGDTDPQGIAQGAGFGPGQGHTAVMRAYLATDVVGGGVGLPLTSGAVGQFDPPLSKH